MGLFSKLINKEGNTTKPCINTEPIKTVTKEDFSKLEEVELSDKKEGLLNLNKGQFLNLKKNDISLNNIRASAGWDFEEGETVYDLDLVAYLQDDKDVKETVYYGKPRHYGIFLDGDNLTGEGEGDDENIYCQLDLLPDDITKISFAVVIYSAGRYKMFSKVKNAYIRLVDEDTDEEILRFKLSENGGNNTAVLAADLIKNDNGWNFVPVEKYTRDDIKSLGEKLNG